MTPPSNGPTPTPASSREVGSSNKGGSLFQGNPLENKSDHITQSLDTSMAPRCPQDLIDTPFHGPQGPTHAASPFSVTPSFFQSPRLWNVPGSLQPHGFQPCGRLCLHCLQLLAQLMPFPPASLRLPPGHRKHPGSLMRDSVIELPARGCEPKRQHGDNEVLWANVTQGGHHSWGWRNTGSLQGVSELAPGL